MLVAAQHILSRKFGVRNLRPSQIVSCICVTVDAIQIGWWCSNSKRYYLPLPHCNTVDIQSHKVSSSVVFEAENLLCTPQALENFYHFFRIRFSYCNISPWTSSPHRYCLLQTSADILQRTELNFSPGVPTLIQYTRISGFASSLYHARHKNVECVLFKLSGILLVMMNRQILFTFFCFFSSWSPEKSLTWTTYIPCFLVYHVNPGDIWRLRNWTKCDFGQAINLIVLNRTSSFHKFVLGFKVPPTNFMFFRKKQ